MVVRDFVPPGSTYFRGAISVLCKSTGVLMLREVFSYYLIDFVNCVKILLNFVKFSNLVFWSPNAPQMISILFPAGQNHAGTLGVRLWGRRFLRFPPERSINTCRYPGFVWNFVKFVWFLMISIDDVLGYIFQQAIFLRKYWATTSLISISDKLFPLATEPSVSMTRPK